MAKESSIQLDTINESTIQGQLKDALDLYRTKHVEDALSIYTQLIQHYMKNLSNKPQCKVSRRTLKEIWEHYAETLFYSANVDFPEEINNAKNELNKHKFSVKSLIYDVFLENEWKRQYEGKFGGPKPKSKSWKSYYLECESDIDKEDSLEKKVKWSVNNGHLNYFRYLISNYEVDVPSLLYSNGQTLLSRSISRQHDHFSFYLLDHFEKSFIEDAHGWTPLHYAMYSGHTQIIQRLIEEKHSINIKDKQGVMPIHVACFRSAFDGLKILLFNGAKVNVFTRNKLSPIHIAFHNRDVQSTELLIDHGADVNQKDPFGRSLLHWAAAQNNSAFLSLLIKNGASINSKDKLGRTALHYCSQFGNSNCINVLVSHKCKINVADNFENTPLLSAAFFDNSPEAAMLYEHGAR